MRTEGLYEVIVHGSVYIELFDCLNVRGEQGCLIAATKRRAHKNDTLDYAFGVSHEKITVVCKGWISRVLEEYLVESLEL